MLFLLPFQHEMIHAYLFVTDNNKVSTMTDNNKVSTSHWTCIHGVLSEPLQNVIWW